jgi:hypothetical protein
MVLPLGLLVCGLMLVLALFGASHTSSAGRLVESVRSRRLLDLAAQGAVEEACGAFEHYTRQSLASALKSGGPVPGVTASTWDTPVPFTTGAYEKAGVKVSPVHILTSPVHTVAKGSTYHGRGVLGFGVIQLELSVGLSRPGEDRSRKVKIRRYMRLLSGGRTGLPVVRVSRQNSLMEVSGS